MPSKGSHNHGADALGMCGPTTLFRERHFHLATAGSSNTSECFLVGPQKTCAPSWSGAALKLTVVPNSYLWCSTQAELVSVMDDAVAMGKAVRRLLTGDEEGHTPEQLDAVRAAIDTLEHSR